MELRPKHKHSSLKPAFHHAVLLPAQEQSHTLPMFVPPLASPPLVIGNFLLFLQRARHLDVFAIMSPKDGFCAITLELATPPPHTFPPPVPLLNASPF